MDAQAVWLKRVFQNKDLRLSIKKQLLVLLQASETFEKIASSLERIIGRLSEQTASTAILPFASGVHNPRHSQRSGKHDKIKITNSSA